MAPMRVTPVDYAINNLESIVELLRGAREATGCTVPIMRAVRVLLVSTLQNIIIPYCDDKKPLDEVLTGLTDEDRCTLLGFINRRLADS